MALAAAVGFGATAVFARLGMRHVSTSSATLMSLIVSTLITLAIAAALHSRGILEIGKVALFLCFLVGLLFYPMGRLLNFAGVRLARVSRASTIVGASPLVATGLAVAVDGESANFWLLAGAISIVGGLSLSLSQQ